MKKILFVCHGNICRSTMAEYVMKDMLKKRGLDRAFEVDSAATSREEIGNPIYPPARKKLLSEGVPIGTHRARQITKADYEYFDHIYIMDHWNQRNILRVLGSDPKDKIEMLLPRDVADPWYTGDFDATYRDVVEGCEKIINEFI
ncbi:MAG: low molecular weight phosphotyrosine protein phosphatase [Firmicutes bacterium]|nr:low molecular weight phosphotyrosine protein phosphatase [Bacillota bacterium]